MVLLRRLSCTLALAVASLCLPATSALGIFGDISTSETYSVETTAIWPGDGQISWERLTVNISVDSPTSDGGTPGITYDTLGSVVYTGWATFSGAGCAVYSLAVQDDNREFSYFLFQDDIWQTAAVQGRISDQPQYTDAGIGVVPDSACYGSCVDKTIGLDPTKPYQNNEANDAASQLAVEVDFVTYSPSAPECENTTAPPALEGDPGPPYPPGLVDGQVVRGMQRVNNSPQPSSNSVNFTAEAQLLIFNASCIFFSMWPRNLSAEDATKFSLALYTKQQLKDATFNLELSQPYNLTSCGLSSCNASAGTWARQFNLVPSHTYWLLSSYAWPYTQDSAIEGIDWLVQAFPPDQCAELQATAPGSPPTPPSPGSSAVASSSSAGIPSKGGGSSAGGIAGGVIGGVCGLALIALLAFFLHRRRTKQRDVKPSNQDHLVSNNTEYGSDTAKTSDVGVGQSYGPPTAAWSLSASDASGLRGSQLSSEVSGGRLASASSSDVHAQWSINPSSIKICTNADGSPVKLGQGGFGSVYKALHDDVRTVAVKISHSGSQAALASLSEDQDAKAFWLEIERLAECRDANVVQFYGICNVSDELWLVTEYCERGDLYSALGRYTGCYSQCILSWYQRGQHLAIDIARGIHALHVRSIVHFDIKSPNILLTRHLDAKIADVGLAHPLFSKSHFSEMSHASVCGFAVILGKLTSTPADIFSFGVVLHELISGERPQRGKLRPIRVPEEGPPEAVQLMEDCLAENPQERPTAKEIINRLQAMVTQQSG